MGAGKSSIARILAKRLQWPIFDTDEMIEAKSKKTISSIFALEGEEAFRKLETEVLDEIKAKEQVIISTGGGIIEKKRNHALLKQNAIIIYLKTTPEAVVKFTSKDNTRPILQDKNPLEVITNRLQRREPIYASLADFSIQTSDKTLEVAAESILQWLDLH